MILNYKEGQFYLQHFDWFSEDEKYWEKEKLRGRQRLFSLLVYLDDVEEGGGTGYPRLNYICKPEKGKGLIHKNKEDGECLEDSLHEALPVVKGEKWVLIVWIREEAWVGDNDFRDKEMDYYEDKS